MVGSRSNRHGNCRSGSGSWDGCPVRRSSGPRIFQIRVAMTSGESTGEMDLVMAGNVKQQSEDREGDQRQEDVG